MKEQKNILQYIHELESLNLHKILNELLEYKVEDIKFILNQNPKIKTKLKEALEE
jgi:hypothetical protein